MAASACLAARSVGRVASPKRAAPAPTAPEETRTTRCPSATRSRAVSQIRARFPRFSEEEAGWRSDDVPTLMTWIERSTVGERGRREGREKGEEEKDEKKRATTMRETSRKRSQIAASKAQEIASNRQSKTFYTKNTTLNLCSEFQKKETRVDQGENKRDAIGQFFPTSSRRGETNSFLFVSISKQIVFLVLFRSPRTTVSPPSLALEKECVLSTCRSVILNLSKKRGSRNDFFSFDFFDFVSL